VADDRSNPKNWLGPYADVDTGWVALRAAERPAYLASALAEYLDVRGWTPDQLAQSLRCAPQQLAKLGLCRRPDRRSVEFHREVSEIASHFELDYFGLRRLLEELALDPQERQQVWMTAEFLDQPLYGAPRPRASAKLMRAQTPDELLQSRRAESSESFMGDGSHTSSEQVPPSMSVETPFRTIPAHRPSWFTRLLSTIREFFSKK
jgi:hypothetical protein